MNLAALIRALPRSALSPATLAQIDGFTDDTDDTARRNRHIRLREPPGAHGMPFVDPARALAILLRSEGAASPRPPAAQIAARLLADAGPARRACYFEHGDPDPPEHIPVTDFVDGLRAAQPGWCAAALDFLEQAAQVAASAPLFRPEQRGRVAPMTQVSLQQLPAHPRSWEHFTFFRAPWCKQDGAQPDRDAAFVAWRQAMRPIVHALEQTLGRELYHFDDHDVMPDDPEDDGQIDFAHRFFVLHWCCTHRPDAGFVRYLLQASGARHADELKAALVAPASFIHPFELDFEQRLWAKRACALRYLPPHARKTLVVVFSTIDARDVAQMLVAEHIGVDVRFVAPPELATHAWMRRAANRCRSWCCLPQHDWLQRPIELLATADEVLIIANDARHSFHPNLSEPAEDLLWLATQLGVKVGYHDIDGWAQSYPGPTLAQRGVPERVAARQLARVAFTRQLDEIRLGIGFGRSGLQDAKGKPISYEQLDLPFALVRRLAAWQRDCLSPVGPDQLRGLPRQRLLEQEQIAIATALQAAHAWQVCFKPPTGRDWVQVGRA